MSMKNVAKAFGTSLRVTAAREKTKLTKPTTIHGRPPPIPVRHASSASAEGHAWREYGSRLALRKAGDASKSLATSAFPGGEKLYAPRLAAGFSWGGATLETARADELSNVIRRSSRLPVTKELASALRGGLHTSWHAPPLLSAVRRGSPRGQLDPNGASSSERPGRNAKFPPPREIWARRRRTTSS